MSSVDITLHTPDTDTVELLSDTKADLKLELPQPFETDAKNTVEVKPLKADLDTTVEVKPLKADLDTATHLRVDPLETDSRVSMDLKPAVVDLCLTLNVGKVPNLCIKQPYRHHIGFTLYGIEVYGLTFAGEQETVIQEQRPEPKVAVGGVSPEWRGHRYQGEHHEHHSPDPPTRESGGLRIRLGG